MESGTQISASVSRTTKKLLDAKPAAIDFYKKYGFVSVDTVEGQYDARPEPTPMFLSVRVIDSLS